MEKSKVRIIINENSLQSKINNNNFCVFFFTEFLADEC
jgi:hypothetical protein